VLVRYLDHLLFRDIREIPQASVRETVGWVVNNTPDHIEVLWDRSVEKLPHERIQDRISGMTILKSAVLGIEPLSPFWTRAPRTRRGRDRKHG